MALEWLNTAGNWLQTGGNLLNAAQPFLNVGASIYDRNQTQNAISDAYGDYRNFANTSMNTLGDIYKQGTQALAPYRSAGRRALSGYENLLRNPNQIVNNPGYQFRFNQGQEALQRSAASKRLLNSGNFATAAQEYGQGFATQEYDNALSRYLPMVQAGQNATGQYINAGQNYGNAVAGINLGLGEAAAGSRIGQAGANSRMVTDFLGLTGGQNNPFGAAADGARTLGNGLNQLGNLIGGGGTAAATSGLGTTGATTAGSALGELGATGTGMTGGTYSGMFGTMDSLAAGEGLSAASGATGGATGATGTTGAAGTAAAGSGAAAMAAIGGAAFLMAGISKFGKGGSAESAKSGKLAEQLGRDAQADPTGQRAQQTIDKLITGKLWPNEGNQWVIYDLMKSGAVSLNTPSLYSKDSVVDIFSPANSVYKLDINDKNSPANAKIWALSGGLNPQQADQFANLYKTYALAQQAGADPTSGRGSMFSGAKGNQAKQQMDAMIKQIESGRIANARSVYRNLRSNGYTGDLSKLETYLGIRRS